MPTLHHRRRHIDHKLELLRDLPAFRSLEAAQLLRVGSLVELVDVPAGTVLTRAGDRAREAYLVIDGRLRVVRGPLTVTTLGPGEFAGEVALLDGRPRATGLEAATAARLCVVDRAGVLRLIDDSPALAGHLLEQLAARVREGVPT